MFFSIIVPVYNVEKYLQKCIDRYMVNNQSPGQNNASLWAGTVALP